MCFKIYFQSVHPTQSHFAIFRLVFFYFIFLPRPSLTQPLNSTMRYLNALICVFLVLQGIFTATAITQAELDALADLKRSIPGVATDWFVNTPEPCRSDNYPNWNYITCTGNRTVSRLRFPYGQLRGTLPDSIGNLSSLVELGIGGNFLDGTIPSSLLRTPLEVFVLDVNFFRSPLPTGLFAMPTLKTVRMGSNSYINETWPTQWSSSLSELRITQSAFTGLLPSSMSNMTNITTLDLRYNPAAMNGSLPSFIANLTTMQNFYIGGCDIQGPLPDLCALVNLVDVSIGQNRINGPFPDLSCLPNLESLAIAAAGLTGTIPSNLSSRLNTMILDANSLSGEFPPQLASNPWVRLSMSQNRYVGPVILY
jgi:hypothetical protein